MNVTRTGDTRRRNGDDAENPRIMTERHHYVSRFHLRGFTDPDADTSRDPWVWIGDCQTGEVKRRAPTNFGWERELYGSPGALADRNSKLETYLAEKVESPAALALRRFCAKRQGARGPIPSEVLCYLAWAAARTPAMRALYQTWIDELAEDRFTLAEQPPKWLLEAKDLHRLHRMEHSAHGIRDDVDPEEVERLKTSGWKFVVGQEDFLELVYVQARYFYERFFPRLNWLTLDAPVGEWFIIGDRPVAWGFWGALTVMPASLRNPNVQLIAPITRTIALVAYNSAGGQPTEVRPSELNQIIASVARKWIAGPSESVVRGALQLRSTK